MDNRMNRTTMALAGALSLVLAGPAAAQVVTGGAGNTGVSPRPALVGRLLALEILARDRSLAATRPTLATPPCPAPRRA